MSHLPRRLNHHIIFLGSFLLGSSCTFRMRESPRERVPDFEVYLDVLDEKLLSFIKYEVSLASAVR